MIINCAEYFYLKDIGYGRTPEIKNISIEEVIKIFKEEGVELTIQEAEQIVEFLKMLLTVTVKRFLDE